MKKSILNIGKILTKNELKVIKGSSEIEGIGDCVPLDGLCKIDPPHKACCYGTSCRRTLSGSTWGICK